MTLVSVALPELVPHEAVHQEVSGGHEAQQDVRDVAEQEVPHWESVSRGPRNHARPEQDLVSFRTEGQPTVLTSSSR